MPRGRKAKVPAQLVHVQVRAIRPQQRTDVLEILRSPGIVYERLEFERNESLGAHHAQGSERRLGLVGMGEEPASDRTMREQEIDPFVFARNSPHRDSGEGSGSRA